MGPVPEQVPGLRPVPGPVPEQVPGLLAHLANAKNIAGSASVSAAVTARSMATDGAEGTARGDNDGDSDGGTPRRGSIHRSFSRNTVRRLSLCSLSLSALKSPHKV